MNRYYGILDEKPGEAIQRWLRHWVPATADRQHIFEVATTTIRYVNASKDKRKRLRINQELEQRWYAALAEGRIDWSVYDTDLYIADLWACWVVYSRQYLLSLRSKKSLGGRSVVQDLGPVSRVVDLGCGFGYTTIALQDMFREATVTGTNLEGTRQWSMLERVSRETGFQIAGDIHKITGPVDLVFASEYFEHIQAPVAHLLDVLVTLRPRALVVANTFGASSIGHFPTYTVEGVQVDGKATSRAFGKALRDHGYEQVKMDVWNNRPTYWRKVS